MRAHYSLGGGIIYLLGEGRLVRTFIMVRPKKVKLFIRRGGDSGRPGKREEKYVLVKGNFHLFSHSKIFGGGVQEKIFGAAPQGRTQRGSLTGKNKIGRPDGGRTLFFYLCFIPERNPSSTSPKLEGGTIGLLKKGGPL